MRRLFNRKAFDVNDPFISIGISDDSSKNFKHGRCHIITDKIYINNALTKYTQARLMKT